MEKNIIYQVNHNLNSDIIEREYVKKTEKFVWYYESQFKTGKQSLNSNTHTSFEKKEDAIAFQEDRIKMELSRYQGAVERYTKMLTDFQAKHNLTK